MVHSSAGARPPRSWAWKSRPTPSEVSGSRTCAQRTRTAAGSRGSESGAPGAFRVGSIQRNVLPIARNRARLVVRFRIVLDEARAQLFHGRSLPRRTSANQSLAIERACSTVNSPNSPMAGFRRSPAFVRCWTINTLRPVGVTLQRKPGTSVSRSSTSCAPARAASTVVLVA